MRLLLKFDARTSREPIISLITLKTNALINILRANIGARSGEMIVEIDDTKVKEVEEILKKHGVELIELGEGVIKDEEKCIHCGLCISICPVDVFKFDKEFKVVTEPSKCIHCGVCVNVCPRRALFLPM